MNFEIKTRNLNRRVKKLVTGLFSEEFLKDWPARIIIITAGILLVAVWLVAVFRFPISEYRVPVRYNSFLGVTELGSWQRLFNVPVFVALCFILNVILANTVYKKDKMISYIFLGINIFNAIAALAVVINLSLLVDY